MNLITTQHFPVQKVVIVTGTSQGIGNTISLHLARAGWSVWATTRDASKFECNERNIHIIELDLTNTMAISETISKVVALEGRIDALINNAGYMMIGPCETVNVEKVEQLFNINLFATMRMVNAVMPVMRKQKYGHIINMGSTSGIQAVPGLGAFAASKFALEGYTQALAIEALSWNINVIIVEIGTVNTPWINNCKIDSCSEVSEYAKIIHQLMLRLIVRTNEAPGGEEVAEVICNALRNSSSGIRLAADTKTEEFISNILVDPPGKRYLEQQQQFLTILDSSKK